jgi:hypothetical protein
MRLLPSALAHLLDVVNCQQNGIEAEEGELNVVRCPVIG